MLSDFLLRLPLVTCPLILISFNFVGIEETFGTTLEFNGIQPSEFAKIVFLLFIFINIFFLLLCIFPSKFCLLNSKLETTYF